MDFPLYCLCFSNQTSETSDQLIQCNSCKNYMHKTCYSITQILEKQLFLCFICKIIISNPYIQITDFLIRPYILPKLAKIEQYHKFQLNFLQLNDIRKEEKKIFFLASKLKLDYNLAKNKNPFYEWPQENIFFFINNKNITFEYNDYGSIHFTSINHKDNELHIISYDGLFENVVFTMFLAQNMEIYDIMRLLSTRKFCCPEEYKTNFDKKIKNSGNLANFFPVFDPYSQNLMDFPCRGRYCEHLCCFDLLNYLIINKTCKEEKLKWKCPLCKNNIYWNELDVDTYLFNIIKEIKKINEDSEQEIRYIKFNQYNSWEINYQIPNYAEIFNEENENEKEKIVKQKEFLLFEYKKNYDPDNKIEKAYYEFKKFLLNNQDLHQSIYGPFKLDISELKDFNLDIFNDFTDLDFYNFLKLINILDCLFSKNYTNKLFKQNSDLSFQLLTNSNLTIKDYLIQFLETSISDLIINYSLCWAKTLDDIIDLICRIICKNGQNFPDVLLMIELIIIFAHQIFSHSFLLQKFFVSDSFSFQYVCGLLLSKLIRKCSFDEIKIGKIFYILSESFTEFGFNSEIPQTHIKKHSDELADFFIILIDDFDDKKFCNFLKDVFLPPTEKSENEEILQFWTNLVVFMVTLFRKRNIEGDLIHIFFEEWDKEKIIEYLIAKK